jgi:hypothetical protein
VADSRRIATDTKDVVLRTILASIVIAPLMPFGAMHTAQSISSDARIQLAAGGHSTFNRDTYTQRARGAMHEWQQKLHAFSEKAKAKGQEEGKAAENELNAAWTKADAEQHKLRSASPEVWVSAKISFEKASHDLKEVWDRMDPMTSRSNPAELTRGFVTVDGSPTSSASAG